MSVHHLDFERRTVHGPFDRGRPPVLTIDPGDTVIYRTLDAGWGFSPTREGDRARGFERHPEHDQGHALNGPIYVRAAEPGDALGIRIDALRPSTYGWTWAGPRPGMERFQLGIESETDVRWEIDPDRMVAADRSGLGLEVPIRPFMGVMGNAPAAPGQHSTAPPRNVGGNIDCRELIPGSTLWLPVEVEGALFSVGDGHAAQGDGEVSGTAIECPMTHVELTFQLQKGARFPAPRAETPAGYLTFGFGDTLDDATGIAVNQMLDHLHQTYHLDRTTALALASLVVDLRITQIVNGILGVHALLPANSFTQAG